MTSKEIRTKEFEKVKFGYQSEEVDAFLRKIEADYRRMEDELAEANNKLMLLADKISEYKENEEDLKNALLSAQKQARQILDEAKEKAKQIEEDAKASATSAQTAAIEEAEQNLKKISKKLDKENRVLVETQRQVAGFKKSLFDMYKSHLEQIANLPDTIDDDDDDAENNSPNAVTAEKTENAAEAETASVKPEEAAAAKQKEEAASGSEDTAEKEAAASEFAADPFDEVAFSASKKSISRTAEFDTRYKDLQFGNRREEKKKRS
jgi:cell division initiation protein